jgi:hypothetical protein
MEERVMKMKFNGDFAGLQGMVRKCRVRGEWRYVEKSGLYQFKAVTGENLNWWPSTGTVTFQGGYKPKLAKRFARRVAQLQRIRPVKSELFRQQQRSAPPW